MARKRLGIVYTVSLLLHAGVALALVSIRTPPPKREPTKIVMHEVKKPPAPPKQEAPPPPPPPEAPKRAAPKPAAPKAAAPKAAPAAAAPAASAAPSGAPDFSLSLSGGGGPGGMAVAAAASGPGPAESKKTLGPKSLTPPKPPNDGCAEDVVKAKALEVPQPEYAEAARAAGIAGKVRVELNVDENGQVVSARVLEGLGHGLDEAALLAAKRARFSPATRCGKATSTTFVIGIRFTL